MKASDLISVLEKAIASDGDRNVAIRFLDSTGVECTESLVRIVRTPDLGYVLEGTL